MSSGIFPQTGDSLCDVLPPSRRVTVRSTSSVSLKERGTCRALFFFQIPKRRTEKRNTLAEGNVKNNEMRFYFFTLSLEKPTRQSAARLNKGPSFSRFICLRLLHRKQWHTKGKSFSESSHTHTHTQKSRLYRLPDELVSCEPRKSTLVTHRRQLKPKTETASADSFSENWKNNQEQKKIAPLFKNKNNKKRASEFTKCVSTEKKKKTPITTERKPQEKEGRLAHANRAATSHRKWRRKKEKKLLFSFFSFLSSLLCCCSLFALAAWPSTNVFLAGQRTTDGDSLSPTSRINKVIT